MTSPTPPAGARLTDEQIAELVHLTSIYATDDPIDPAWRDTLTALRELQAHRAAARVSGGEAVERPCAHRLEFQIAEGRFKCVDCGERFLSQQPVPKPTAQEVAPPTLERWLRDYRIVSPAAMDGFVCVPVEEVREALSRVAPPAPSVDLEQLARRVATAGTSSPDSVAAIGALQDYLAALQRARETGISK